MMRNTSFLFGVVVATVVWNQVCADEKSNREAELDAVTKILTDKTYELRYKFSKGQTLRWKVEHLANTKTTIKGNTQTALSSSISTKVWKVTDVADNGHITFVHSVSDVLMRQKVSDRPEIIYDSKTDQAPPPIYLAVAETVGVPMFVVTIDQQGRVIKRESKHKQTEHSQIGIEQMTVQLPKQAIRVGTDWQSPSEIKVRLPDQRVKTIKLRRLYTLSKVHAGVATIEVKTEVLTPIDDPKIKLNLLQRLNHGTIKFDIDAGRILHKQMNWDETVINFNGAQSIMHYLARFKEEFLPHESTARNSTSTRTKRK